jgi:hypothetical protein
MRFHKHREEKDIPLSEFALVGETKEPKFSHLVAKSHGHELAYRVVPVNRWGVPAAKLREEVAKGAFVAARITTTLAPSAPVLLHATPGPHELTLKFQANPANENITVYHVYRKVVETPAKLTPVKASGTAAEHREHFLLEVIHDKRSLVAHGPLADHVGAGAARFDVVHHEPILAEYERPVKDAKARGGVKAPALPEHLIHGAEKLCDVLPDGKLAVSVPGVTVTKDDHGHFVVTDHHATAAGQDHLYYVEADNGLTSKRSHVLDAQPHHIAAKSPSDVKAANVTPHGVHVTWDKGDAKAFIVQRAEKAAGPFFQMSGLHKEASFVDHTVHDNATYVYRVLALNADGHLSPPSAPAIVTTPAN